MMGREEEEKKNREGVKKMKVLGTQSALSVRWLCMRGFRKGGGIQGGGIPGRGRRRAGERRGLPPVHPQIVGKLY